MDDKSSKAFDFASDVAKQMVTLATSIVTFTIIFSNELYGATRWIAVSAWCSFLTSAIFGLWTLMALTGTLAAPNGDEAGPKIGRNIRIPATLQIFTFMLAVFLTMVFVFFYHPGAKPTAIPAIPYH